MPTNPQRFQRDEEALQRFRQALAAAPEQLPLRRLMATFLLGQACFSEARGHLEFLRERGVADAPWRFHMAWALLGEGREGEAEALVKKDAAQCSRLGYKASDMGRWEAFGRLTERAAELQPRSSEATFDQAIALDYLGDFRKSLELLRKLEVRKGLAPELKGRAGQHRSQTQLLLGELREGFQLMEARPPAPESRPLPLLHWDGSSLAGRSILLRSEQGFGDGFMFLRYATLLARQGAQVYVEAMVGTRELVLTCPGVVGVLEEGTPLPPGTLQVPMMSLAHRLGTELDTIPAPIPYLGVPERVPHRQALERLIPAHPGLRLGLVWTGNQRHKRNGERSIPPSCLERLGELPGVTWFSLQKGAEDRPELPLVDLGPHLQDFSDTALALSLLDGLVTVDTSVAHLAGAMGRPGWLLLPRFPDWRWLLERTDSPWYPTLRLLRQPRHWDWDGVVEALLRELRTRLEPLPGTAAGESVGGIAP